MFKRPAGTICSKKALIEHMHSDKPCYIASRKHRRLDEYTNISSVSEVLFRGSDRKYTKFTVSRDNKGASHHLLDHNIPKNNYNDWYVFTNRNDALTWAYGDLKED